MNTNHFRHEILGFFMAAALLTACASKEESPEPPAQAPESSSSQPLKREESILVTTTAKVEAIDVENREVTLRGPMGEVATFVVDERVKRLAEVRVGDQVKAEYYAAVAAELREPTAEEKAAPFVLVEASARAPKGTSPAGGSLRTFKVVATVEDLNPDTHTVTLKGPRGNRLAVRARDVNNFNRLHLGDTIVVTYTEALAVSLNKIGSDAR